MTTPLVSRLHDALGLQTSATQYGDYVLIADTAQAWWCSMVDITEEIVADYERGPDYDEEGDVYATPWQRLCDTVTGLHDDEVSPSAVEAAVEAQGADADGDISWGW